MGKGIKRRFVFYISEAGEKLARKIITIYPEAEKLKYAKKAVGEIWGEAESIVFIMACGIAVRAIAPFVKDKKDDPAVVALDEKGQNAISLLSGHLGGANRITMELAGLFNANPVISTATDLNGLYSIDLFASEKGFMIENPALLSKISARHLGEKKLSIHSDIEMNFPPDYEKTGPEKADVIVSNRVHPHKCLYLRPKNLIIGVGLNSGTSAEEIGASVRAVFKENGFSFDSIKLIATHEKKLSEPGLADFARESGIPLRGFMPQELNSVLNINESGAAKRALGVQGVAEPSAILASHNGRLLLQKVKRGNITLAVAESNEIVIYVIGTGPGGLEHITPRALLLIREADVIVGYKTYLEQIKSLIKDKEIKASGMMQEVDRAKAALETAQTGNKVCVISGGDPGIYGMAGLLLEVAKNSNGRPVRVEVIPGISALNACASRLGAPLMHDFAVVSLSDRLTPWEVIESRLEAAAKADFVIVLYNPRSKSRTRQIERAREIILKVRAGDTPVGIVKGATREDEKIILTTLADLPFAEIDMQSTVIIGNSNTERFGDYLITPRGYEKKYAL